MPPIIDTTGRKSSGLAYCLRGQQQWIAKEIVEKFIPPIVVTHKLMDLIACIWTNSVYFSHVDLLKV